MTTNASTILVYADEMPGFKITKRTEIKRQQQPSTSKFRITLSKFSYKPSQNIEVNEYVVGGGEVTIN